MQVLKRRAPPSASISRPKEAYAVTAGIALTLGGLKISNAAAVEDNSGHDDLPGLLYHNYASGTGLTWGAVFGRIAGRSAAAYAWE
jgi:tricarballylate dehydrogenase